MAQVPLWHHHDRRRLRGSQGAALGQSPSLASEGVLRALDALGTAGPGTAAGSGCNGGPGGRDRGSDGEPAVNQGGPAPGERAHFLINAAFGLRQTAGNWPSRPGGSPPGLTTTASLDRRARRERPASVGRQVPPVTSSACHGQPTGLELPPRCLQGRSILATRTSIRGPRRGVQGHRRRGMLRA